MKNKVFINGRIISDGKIYDNYNLIISNDRIVEFIDETGSLTGYETIDLKGNYLCSGFIDLQIMGANGALYGGNPTPEGLDIMERALVKEGVVAFLPTISTNSLLVLKKAISIAKKYREKALGNFFGLHLEGPFISEKSRGAHPKEFIRKPSIEDIKEILNGDHDEVKMLTIAPEQFDGETLAYLDEQKIILAMGHTSATYLETINFFTGSQAVTHLFNGMPSIHHRNPGPIPAIFEKKPYTSIVADGIHVDFSIVAFAKRNLGEFLYLISDAATPCSTGIYQHKDGGNRFVTNNPDNETEVLSGSKLTMMKAIKNCVQYIGITLEEAINMATLYPSRLLGIDNEYGSIKSSKLANFVVFDHNYEIQNVYFKGVSMDV